MVTKSLAETPFGKKLVYTIDGECIWSEYLPFAKPNRALEAAGQCGRSGGVLSQIRKGMRTVFLRKAS